MKIAALFLVVCLGLAFAADAPCPYSTLKKVSIDGTGIDVLRIVHNLGNDIEITFTPSTLSVLTAKANISTDSSATYLNQTSVKWVINGTTAYLNVNAHFVDIPDHPNAGVSLKPTTGSIVNLVLLSIFAFFGELMGLKRRSMVLFLIVLGVSYIIALPNCVSVKVNLTLPANIKMYCENNVCVNITTPVENHNTTTNTNTTQNTNGTVSTSSSSGVITNTTTGTNQTTTGGTGAPVNGTTTTNGTATGVPDWVGNVTVLENKNCTNQGCCELIQNYNADTGDAYLQFNPECRSTPPAGFCFQQTGCQACSNPSAPHYVNNGLPNCTRFQTRS